MVATAEVGKQNYHPAPAPLVEGGPLKGELRPLAAPSYVGELAVLPLRWARPKTDAGCPGHSSCPQAVAGSESRNGSRVHDDAVEGYCPMGRSQRSAMMREATGLRL